MGKTSNEKWDEKNEEYDLTHHNIKGARWAEERLRYSELHGKGATLRMSKSLMVQEGWKRFRLGQPRVLGMAYKSGSPGYFNVTLKYVKTGSPGYNDIGRTMVYKVKALTRYGAVMKALEHLRLYGPPKSSRSQVNVAQ